MDFRKHKRTPSELLVNFAGEQIIGKGTLCDLSQAGCGVSTEEKVPAGAFMEVQIDFPGQHDLVKIDVAVVRYTIPHRFGLDFLQITPDNEKKLKQLLKLL